MNDTVDGNVQPEARVNPLLERIRMPGETFTLPSKGLLYNHGELSDDVKNGEVTILPMTAMEEIIMRSPDKLFSGGAIHDIFSRCIPQIVNPMEMFSKDIDFLLVALRKVSYGSEFEVEYKHDCKGAKGHSYMVKIDQFISATKGIDPTKIGSTFTCELENGQSVAMRPIRYRNVVDALQLIQQLESTGVMPTIEEAQQQQLQTLLGVIDNVDGIDDKSMIEEWLRELKAGEADRIQKTLATINDWGPVFSSKVRCKDCGEEIDVATPLNPMSFFISSFRRET